MSALIIIRDAGEATSLHLVKPRCLSVFEIFPHRERERENKMNEKPKDPCQPKPFVGVLVGAGVREGICLKDFQDAPPPWLI
jgi:hypothetical protein